MASSHPSLLLVLGVTQPGVCASYVLHVISVMWANQAGKSLGIELVAHYSMLSLSLNGLVTACTRILLVAVMCLVASFYFHALHVLYLSSPLFMCDWKEPRFKFVRWVPASVGLDVAWTSLGLQCVCVCVCVCVGGEAAGESARRHHGRYPPSPRGFVFLY